MRLQMFSLLWKYMILCAILGLGHISTTRAAFDCNLNDPADCSCVTISASTTSTTLLTETSATLVCTVTSTTGDEVQWLKGSVALGTEPNIPSEPRYEMDNITYSLYITNVQISDQATYKCQVNACALKPYNTVSNGLNIQVYVLPSNPVVTNMSSDGTVDVIESDPSSLVCSTTNAKPQATIRWYSETTGELLQSMHANTQNSDGETFDSSATYTFTPSGTDDGAAYVCRVSGDAVSLTGSTDIDTRITLNVISKPVTFVATGITNGGTLTVDLDQSTIVDCQASSTDSNLELTWERNGISQTSTTVTESVNSTLTLFTNSIEIVGTEGNDGAVYECVVTVPGQTLTYQDQISFSITIYKFPLGWVIGGSILGLILLILLIILIACCIRKKKKKVETFTDPVVDTPPHQEMVIANPNLEREEKEEPVDETVAETTTEQAHQRAPPDEHESTASSSDEEDEFDALAHEDVISNLPDGDVFSLSSSMMRSDRGSPVPNDGDIHDYKDVSNEQNEYYETTVQSFYV